MASFCRVLEPNMTLRVLDLSYNRLSPEAVRLLADLTGHNKTLEFIGLAKNNLTLEDFKPLLDIIGRFPFDADGVDEHQKKIKERDQIAEKNKKVKPGNPKEKVPGVDAIEQNEETQEWSILKNWHIRHVNMCLNPIDDSAREYLMELMGRTPAEFSITLSGTDLDENTVHEMSEALCTDENPTLGQQRIIY